MADPHVNGAYSTVLTPPSPAASGLTLTVQPGEGALFPTPGTVGFRVTICPAGARPTIANMEVVRVTGVAGDVFTLAARALTGEGTSARTIVAGDQVFCGITKGMLEDLETNCDVQIFTTPGANTWTKPAGAKSVLVQLIAGGGGGGSGRKGAAGSVRFGGGAGAGGGISEKQFVASTLSATETVTVGAGGTGGASQTVNSTDGNDGNDGIATTFGTKFKAGFGAKGLKGTAATGTGGSAPLHYPDSGVLFLNYGRGGSSSGTTVPTAGDNPATGTPSGGGGGGGITAANAFQNGALGGGGTAGTGYATAIAGGAAGLVGGPAAGGNGSDITANILFGGSGGGGGAAAAGGNGGNGGKYGAGGGGGGAAVDAVSNSGAGGTGGNGIAIITSFY